MCASSQFENRIRKLNFTQQAHEFNVIIIHSFSVYKFQQRPAKLYSVTIRFYIGFSFFYLIITRCAWLTFRAWEPLAVTCSFPASEHWPCKSLRHRLCSYVRVGQHHMRSHACWLNFSTGSFPRLPADDCSPWQNFKVCEHKVHSKTFQSIVYLIEDNKLLEKWVMGSWRGICWPRVYRFVIMETWAEASCLKQPSSHVCKAIPQRA